MKIIVTGGAGFIGTNFIYYELKEHPEDEIICVDNLTYAGNLENLRGAFENLNFHFIKADISDEEAIDKIFAQYKPDMVVNFAAESHVDRSISDPGIFIKTNVLGTQVLMNACRKYNVSRYHQVSTDEVYGDLPLDRPDLLFKETSPLQTSSPYSSSKASADLLVMSYYRTFGLSVTISRCSNNYGPYQYPEKLIPVMIYKALEDEKLPIYGNGLNVRDWIYVEDHCIAIDKILRQGVPGEIYNVGTNNEKTNLEIVHTILKSLNKSERLIKFVADRPGHDLRYAIDSKKIKKELGWCPLTSFSEGMRKTIEWFVEHKEKNK